MCWRTYFCSKRASNGMGGITGGLGKLPVLLLLWVLSGNAIGVGHPLVVELSVLPERSMRKTKAFAILGQLCPRDRVTNGTTRVWTRPVQKNTPVRVGLKGDCTAR